MRSLRRLTAVAAMILGAATVAVTAFTSAAQAGDPPFQCPFC